MSHNEENCINCGTGIGGGDRPSEATGDTGHCSNCDELPAVLCRPCVRQQIEEAVDSYIDDKGHGHCQGCIRAGGARKCPGVEGGERVSADATPDDDARARAFWKKHGWEAASPQGNIVPHIATLIAEVRAEETAQWSSIVTAQRKSAYERGCEEGTQRRERATDPYNEALLRVAVAARDVVDGDGPPALGSVWVLRDALKVLDASAKEGT